MANELTNQYINNYGVTERKKKELDALAISLLNAEYKVSQFQAIVDSLTAKSVEFEGFLQNADAARAQALANFNTIQDIQKEVVNLSYNSQITLAESNAALLKSERLALQIKQVIDQLIYSVEIINKFTSLIISKKALNPLISDDLVSLASVAGKDANTAVALTLVALKSSFVANATNIEAQGLVIVVNTQSQNLKANWGEKAKQTPAADTQQPPVQDEFKSIYTLLQDANQQAIANYAVISSANDAVLGELDDAKIKLDKATVKLKSLQLGYAAANAAALAS
jgi:hypothetical protein